jgi:hypothetical protein
VTCKLFLSRTSPTTVAAATIRIILGQHKSDNNN